MLKVAVLETQTVHADGSETWQRVRCRDVSEARVEASLLSMAFYDVLGRTAQHEKHPRSMSPSEGSSGDWYSNDYGEPICVRAVEITVDEMPIPLGIFRLNP
jgi:hypothetical protein